MALKITTTIRNMDESSSKTWREDNNGTSQDWAALKAAQDDDVEVQVLCEVTDGYYDIVLPDGNIISALSFYHLDGFKRSGIIL